MESSVNERPLMKPAEVGEKLGIPEKTLAQWRYLGTGPKWSRIGRYVRYRWEDVDHWIDMQALLARRA
jgi:predicted DNA-binding transcriptional regulator AlpA